MHSDPDILRAAIDATGLDQTAFGRLLGHPDGAQVRAWLAGRVTLSTAVRLLLRVIAAHPRTMVRWLADAG